MIVPIRLYGDACLKEEAYDVELEEDDNVFELVQDLFETLDVSVTGVGLAATQIGVPLRVFVAQHDGFRSEFINPVIKTKSDEVESAEEGCLSIPTVSVDVNRSKTITLEYWVVDEHAIGLIRKTEEFSDYLARIIQHEIDHLDGICITDKVSGIAKKVLQPKLNIILGGKKEYRYPTLHRKSVKYEDISWEILNKYVTL